MIKNKICSCSVCKNYPICIVYQTFLKKVHPNFPAIEGTFFRECMKDLASDCKLYQYEEPINGLKVVRNLEERGL